MHKAIPALGPITSFKGTAVPLIAGRNNCNRDGLPLAVMNIRLQLASLPPGFAR
jgi:hypothetical protein